MSLLILVVDDDPAIRLSVSYSLEEYGYFVITAENGKAALKIIDEYQPHLIVTDIAMPQMNGYELIHWVRQRPAFRLLPIVFLTGKTDTKDRIRGYQLGGDAYLPKPLELNELYAVIRNLLERSQLISQLMQWQWRSQNQEQSIKMLATQADAILQSPLSNWEQTVSATTINRNPLGKPEQIIQTAIHQILLTKREQAVLKFLTDGLSNSQIASRLYLSPRTIEKYVSNLLCKTRTSNRVELLRFAIENHLIDWQSSTEANSILAAK